MARARGPVGGPLTMTAGLGRGSTANIKSQARSQPPTASVHQSKPRYLNCSLVSFHVQAAYTWHGTTASFRKYVPRNGIYSNGTPLRSVPRQPQLPPHCHFCPPLPHPSLSRLPHAAFNDSSPASAVATLPSRNIILRSSLPCSCAAVAVQFECTAMPHAQQ